MAKLKKAFFCQNCGAQHSQWQGKCNGCGEWNTLIEELLIKNPEKEWSEFVTRCVDNGKGEMRLEEFDYYFELFMKFPH